MIFSDFSSRMLSTRFFSSFAFFFPYFNLLDTLGCEDGSGLAFSDGSLISFVIAVAAVRSGSFEVVVLGTVSAINSP